MTNNTTPETPQSQDWLAHLLEVRDEHAAAEKAKNDAMVAAWNKKAGAQLSEALSYIGIDTGELTENAYREGVFRFKLGLVYDSNYLDYIAEPRLVRRFAHGSVQGVPQDPRIEFRLMVTLADYVGASPTYVVDMCGSTDPDDDSWKPHKAALADRIEKLMNFNPTASEDESQPETMAELADQLEGILGLQSEGREENDKSEEDILAKAQATIDRLTATLHTIAHASYVDIPVEWGTALRDQDADLLTYVKELARQALTEK